MIVENNRAFTHSIVQCKICNGRGNIEIYREDLEEFEEVECLCQGPYLKRKS